MVAAAVLVQLLKSSSHRRLTSRIHVLSILYLFVNRFNIILVDYLIKSTKSHVLFLTRHRAPYGINQKLLFIKEYTQQKRVHVVAI